MKNLTPTPELIRAALGHIPANLPRDEWARVAMSIKSEFPDETGFALFDDWSSTADGYDTKAARSTWRSVKGSGGIGIGTLFHLAQQHGYTPPTGDTQPAPPSSQELAERERKKQLARDREKARTQTAHAHAAIEAEVLWAEAQDSGHSPYLERKGVQAYGVRFAADGWLFVPVVDAAGKLWNLQRIAPHKTADDGPDKLFLKGGRKSGLWHMIGPPPADGAGPLLVAEGYATAASLHEATGHPVAVAFDAGNLWAVAKAMRSQYPAAPLVLCGDDDVQTHERTGKNTGREKATAAAKAVGGVAVFPAPLPDGGSDFNDLHQSHGLEAVRACVVAAVEAFQTRASVSRTGDSLSPVQNGGDVLDLDVFRVDDSGVWHVGIEQDGKRKSPEWVCSRLDVQALTRDQDGGGWGYLLAFADPLGKPKQWAMPARMLSGDGGEYRATLLNMGLRIASSAKARNLLTQYIQTRQPEEFASCTDRIGWHGRAFILPHESIGDDAERIVYQTDGAVENTFKVKGSPEQWRERVGALCAGNSRLVFAVSCAFAGPLLRPAGVESGGFHIRGDSSSGKTTALKVAASVYGGASFLQRWRTTDNALEAIAAQHSDCLLILDELAQVDPKTAGECAYMLANEQSKARATRTGAPRARLAWRLLFLSAGELGLADHMAEGMKRTRTGQEVRMADIPADAGAGMGAFEQLHGMEGGAVFAKHITQQAQAVYGAVGHAWLQYLCEHVDSIKATVRDAAGRLAAQFVPEGASGQVERVGARFALVGAAGELATVAGLTGWAKGEGERAARECFNAWLASRGGIGNGEVVAMLRAVRRFLETNGDGRFTMWHRAADDHAAKTLNRAGVRRMVGEDGQPIKSDAEHQREYGERMSPALGEGVSYEYFVLAETFKAEVCQGFDSTAVCKVLLDYGCLKPDKGRTYDCKPRLPGVGLTRCYRITPEIFALDL